LNDRKADSAIDGAKDLMYLGPVYALVTLDMANFYRNLCILSSRNFVTATYITCLHTRRLLRRQVASWAAQ
jgi:hypothetical protein